MIIRLSLAAAILLAGASGRVFAGTVHVPKDHTAIQAAIDAAMSGDTVLVAVGTYRERLRLKDGVTLRSAGDDAKGKLGLKRAESTIIEGGGKEGDGPGVAMAEGATFDGFTVTNVGVYDDAEWNKHHATQGNDQPHEHIGQPGTAGIGVIGVTCTIKNNIVHHIGYSGIAIQGADGKHCAPHVLHNVCYRNMGGGIGSMRGSTAIIEGNTCFQNFYAGIGHEGASPLVIRNTCYENIRAGIGISEGAKPVVRGNKCYRNRRAGIGTRTGHDTSPIIEENDCYENDMAGIGSEEESTPLIRNNRCYDNTLAGIGSRDQARPVIVGNKCFRNKQSGIGSEGGARSLITDNECYENETAGIGQRGDAQTTLIGNHVHHNKAAGLGFDECRAGRSEVVNNRVIDNDKVAVGIHSGWKVRLVGNELSRKDGLPPIVMVFKGAEADFASNAIRGSGVAGIRVEGIIRVTSNTFDCPALREGGGPPQFAVWGLPGSDVVFSSNTVHGWRHALSAEKATVTACDNRIANYGSVGIKIDQPIGTPVVVGNVFESERERVGVAITGGTGIVDNNRVEKPKPTGSKDTDASK
ncbi:MAG: right-handed parallel beta-helix repeat-containing protein [Planctomycetota bacterium]|nr:right-handed parallel beta-helix repeat-containing protein [Planctomycetota bacterium]